MERSPHPELDQPHRILGPIRPVRPQPDQPIERVAVRVQGRDDDDTRLTPLATEPAGSGGGQISEPGEAKLAQIGQHQAPRRQRRHQIARRDLLVLLGIGKMRDRAPELPPHIEDARQFPRQPLAIAGEMNEALGLERCRAILPRLLGRLPGLALGDVEQPHQCWTTPS